MSLVRRPLAVALVASLLMLVLAPETGGGGPATAEAASYTCFGKPATIIGTSGSDTLAGTSGADVIVGLGGNDSIDGRGGNDRICGGGGDDVIYGRSGRDRIAGGRGDDIVFAGAGPDTLKGGPGTDILLGQGGDDLLSGGADVDLVGFILASKAVTADLREGYAVGEGSDAVTTVEGFIGSRFADRLYGDSAVNYFVGGAGRDYINGRGAGDFVLYALAQAAVTVDLAEGIARGEGGDRLVSIESAVGSDYNDVLRGTAGANYLDGGAGVDTIRGRGGQDVCIGETKSGCPLVLDKSETPPDGSVPPPPGATANNLGAPPANTLGAPSIGELTRTADAVGTASGPLGSAVNCPSGWSSAWIIFPNVNGMGFYAYRTFHPFSGWTDWRYNSHYLWHDATGWWVYVSGTWYRFAGAGELGGDTVYGGANITVHAQYYSYAAGGWYDMGLCQTSAYNIGFF